LWRGTKSPEEFSKQIKQLQDSNRVIQLERDNLKKSNLQLNIDFNRLQDSIIVDSSLISKINIQLDKSQSDLSIASDRADKLQAKLDMSDKKIQSLRNNPILRKDNDLIKSLKEKLK